MQCNRFEFQPLNISKLRLFAAVLIIFFTLFISGCATMTVTNTEIEKRRALSIGAVSSDGKLTSKMVANVRNKGVVQPFRKTLRNSRKPYTFEPSAVYTDSDNVYLINDKPFPPSYHSPFLKFNRIMLDQLLVPRRSIQGVESSVVSKAKKIEAVTKLQDQPFVFATTSFSYYQKDSSSHDNNNQLIYWPAGSPNRAKIANVSSRNDQVSSRSIRKMLSDSLKNSMFINGPDFFKIEGLASLPGNRLVFGIRGMGNSYKDATYQFILIEAQLEVTTGKRSNRKFEIVKMKKLYEYKVNERSNRQSLNIDYPIGISSIEYDSSKNGLFILTSYEVDDNMGGYLWFLPIENIENNLPPELIHNNKQHPLKFAHKPEGLAFLDDKTLLVIFDDDRREGTVQNGSSAIFRSINRAAFAVVDLE